tara:strand:- start:12254 stop:12703 length:450 start_codon:yes stop_codon:yes gene_type:complete
MAESAMAGAPEPEQERLLPRDPAILVKMLQSDEGTFLQELGALHRQIHDFHFDEKPNLKDVLAILTAEQRRVPLDVAHLILSEYLDTTTDSGRTNLLKLGQAELGLSGDQAIEIGEMLLVNSIYAIFGPFHAQGGWVDVDEPIFFRSVL